VFYNICGGKQVSYIDMLDATEGFPGLDDESEAPGDSAETTDAKKKPDTGSGVRLLNGVVDLKGIEPSNLTDAKRFRKLFRLVSAPFSRFRWSSLHLQASLTRCFPCVPVTSVVGSVVRNASRL